MAICVLCRQSAPSDIARDPQGVPRAASLVQCSTCGMHIVTKMLEEDARRLSERDRWRLSAITRKASDDGRVLEVSSSNYSQLLEATPQPSEPEQMDLVLAHIAEQSGPERRPVFVNTATDYPLFSAAGPQGLAFLLNSLAEKGLVEIHTKRRPDNVMSPHFQLTMAGHERLQARYRRPRGATGWERVDRSLKDAEDRLAQATSEEQFQSVGHLCRETLISLGQAVFDPERHPTTDGKKASPTDAVRMLDAYVAKELQAAATTS